MDEALKKKVMGALAAGVAAFMFGGSQIVDLNNRLVALEEIHPELKQAELDAIAEELETEETPPALAKPGMATPSLDAPDHLELNENDEWVPVEESSEEPVEEVSEEVEED
jgi:hypothetical protein